MPDFGSTVKDTGTGALIGGSVGGPVGAGIGAGAGLIYGLLDDGAPQNHFSGSVNTLDQGQLYGTSQAGYDASGRRRAPQAGATTIDQNGSNEWRGDQRSLSQAVLDRAMGRGGPSVAQNMLSQATDQNARQAAAVAGSQRGGSSPLAGRTLAQNTMGIQQTAAGQGATMQAQEQEAAQGLAGQLIGQGRQQDIGLATDQASLTQQQRLANVQAQLAQTGMNDEQQRAYLASMFGIDAANMASANHTQDLNAGVAQTNAAAQAAYQAGQDQLLGAGITAAAHASDARAKKNVEDASHEVVRQSPDLLGRALDWLTGDKSHEGQVSTWAPYGVKPTGPVQDEIDRDGEKQAFEKSERDRYDNMSQEEINHRLQAYKDRDADLAEVWARTHAAAVQKAGDKKAGDAARQKLGLMPSDERAKTGTKPANVPGTSPASAKLQDLLDSLKPVTYEYKDQARFGDGKRAGVLAQDVETSSLGKGIVGELPDGTKALDKEKLLGALTAGVGQMNERMKKLEAAFSKKRKK